MVIVSDASPIIALSEIDRLTLLKDVFGTIVITDIVQLESQIAETDWIEVHNDYDQDVFEVVSLQIDRGEASAIALAKQHDNVMLVIDERRGRKVAAGLGIKIIGLLGVIVKAKKMGVIDKGMEIINQLIENGFRVSENLVEIVRNKLEE